MEQDPKTAIQSLISEVRQKVPFGLSFDGYCEGRCDVCPQKLIEFLDIEVSHWESRIKHGVIPSAGEIENLRKDYQKVYHILEKSALAKADRTD
jgi:hypothetical protein